MKYQLSEETINQVLQYLGTCPFSQVAHLIHKIRQEAKEVDSEQPVKNKPSKE